MSIRITGGTWRGRVLRAPVPEGVRPTAARVREAVFSMIGQDLSGWSFLDAFGGSGLMAIEAWSRGADPVTVVERAPRAYHAILQNISGTSVRALRGDAATTGGAADLVWLDPPYQEDIGAWLVRMAPRAHRMLAAEAEAGAAWPTLDGWTREVARRWGDTAVALYVRAGADTGVAEPDIVGDDGGVVEAEGR